MAGDICGAIFIPTRPLQSSVCTLAAGHEGKHSFSTALTLARRLAEVERERDAAEKGLADAHDMLKRAVRIQQAAGDYLKAESERDAAWLRVSDFDEPGSISRADYLPFEKAAEAALATLRAAMGEEVRDG